jgi:hypothetical protein
MKRPLLKRPLFALSALVGTAISVFSAHFAAAEKPQKPIQLAITCFKSGEQTSGSNKICYYNCMGSQAAITIPFTSLCPLTIDQ